MREHPPDPEVHADLRLRDQTARERADRRGVEGLVDGQDPDGLSPRLAALYSSAPDPIVEHWPCRGGCGTLVGVTKVGIDEFDAMNRRLRSMRQEPMAKHKVMWCPACKRRDDELAQLQHDAKRRPHEQQAMPIGQPSEHASGMRTQSPRRRKP
jgi:hypothetical protein